MTERGPGERTRVRRLPEKACYDVETISAIFDGAPFCHVSAVVEGLAMALPTLHAREANTIYLHGSNSNAVLRAALAQPQVMVTATIYEGLRLARSGFESSIAYRSAVVLGPLVEIENLDEKQRVLDLLIDQALPGRSSEIRRASERELRLTLVVALSIEEGSAKISEGPTDDDEDDLALPLWGGILPARLVYGEPIPDRRGAMATGALDLPASLRRFGVAGA
ncbi:MAG TPA: pyridoxamine 5'-phosphate oxidase family protein [Acidimicrobiales bacterium]|nr:pyridoxamine 5'-phosphate oxidase family protein [Acidimicrobiales bacterium]HVB19041.1 pyridoxamine 5'-phosphate oxidase family protein [Acidimicrobiales bacterium]